MKIICIGRNYVEHAKELNNEVPDEPVVFLKPQTALILPRNPLYYPNFTKDLHYEVELVVRINRLGKHIEEQHASKYYAEIGLGIDFTARDVQKKCKEKGLPWEKAKAFDGSAALSQEFIPVDELGGPNSIDFRLEQNGEVVQQGTSAHMIFPIDRIIAYTSTLFTLKIGDLIYTGTPAGVGPVAIGDTLEGFIGDKKMFRVNVR